MSNPNNPNPFLSGFSEATFRTQVEITPWPKRFDYQSPLFFLGSCFSEHIAEQMRLRFFPVYSNPFGVVYHPLALARQLDRLLSGKMFDRSELFCHQGEFGHFLAGTRFSDPNPDHCLESMNARFQEAASFLSLTRFLLLSFGTARAFYHSSMPEGEPVVNCHRIPAPDFQSRISEPEEIADTWIKLIDRLTDLIPGCQLVFTLSPVRYLKEGSEGNSLIKSILRLAIHRIIQERPGCYYFPSFEILIDDLRDYRFYASDLIHPSGLAVDYIFYRFLESGMRPEARVLIQQAEKIRKARAHKPFRPESPGYQAHLETLEKLEKSFLAMPGSPDTRFTPHWERN